MNAIPKYCSDLSSEVAEPLYGTAPRTDTWILLEYPFPLEKKAFEESVLPDAVKQHLRKEQERLPNPRLQLIHNKAYSRKSGFSFFVVQTSDKYTHMVRDHIASYLDLLELDLLSMITNSQAESENNSNEPIFLVCTNGKRDRCCAKNGVEIFAGLSDYAKSAVWQSSHVGGHRFAANMVCFPHGIYYGRVRPGDAATLVDAYRAGQLVLKQYRGRACYNPEQQSAEYYLRTHTGITAVDDLWLTDTQELGSDRYQIQFGSKAGVSYQVRIRSALSEYKIFESCSSPEKLVHQNLFYLESISR